MEDYRSFSAEDLADWDFPAADEPCMDLPPMIGTDERRMHVRAYEMWLSLLDGRDYPDIADLDADRLGEFGPYSVLLDFSDDRANPTIAYLGRTLRDEAEISSEIRTVADVPERALLSRLTDHYLQIIANRAPIGFEAEFVGTRGHNTMYLGILMPFSSYEDSIDFIYGVINWKEMVDAETQAKLDAEVDDSVRNAPPRHVPTAPVWADGPGSTLVDQDVVVEEDPLPPAASLADRLMLARQTAAAARAADTRSRAALYRALGRAHDFALAIDADREAYAALLAESGIVAQDRAPMTPVVKLVFGADYDKTRLTEFATVLVHAAETGIGHGELVAFLEGVEGGIKGVVKAARAARRPAKSTATLARARAVLDARPSLATVAIATKLEAGEYVTLLARATETGTLDIVASMDGDAALTERAVRAVAGDRY